MNDPRRPKMVGWYDPRQLVRTGIDVLVSTIFGRHADARLIEAVSSGPAVVLDYTGPEFRRVPLAAAEPSGSVEDHAETWIDYAADVGDGWDSTYAVAEAMARPVLEFADQDGSLHTTHRGSILVFGGDQVYPVASARQYRERLVAPYRAAFGAEPGPDVYAIPGNHDWYDSLVAFTRLFCGGRSFAGTGRTRQDRSYFALRLPRGWWLLGADVQLGSDVDAPQVDYFRRVADLMGPDDRIVLCVAEPRWIYARGRAADSDPEADESNLDFLERAVLGRKVAVSLAGDLHHYRRHESPDGAQEITAGGGGAFLHPTHGGPDVTTLDGGFRLMVSFPDVATSRRLTYRNLLFPLLNPRFGLFTGALYVLVLWLALPAIVRSRLHERPFLEALGAILFAIGVNPLGSAAWLLAIFAGFVLFTDSPSKPFRVAAGIGHAALHLLAALALSHGIWTRLVEPRVSGPLGRIWLTTALLFAAGAVVGSWLWGVYLLVALNVFGQHANEAFSSLGIADYKNFLRMRIARDGTLAIFPVGIPKVARDGPSEAVLIEPPIVVRGPR